MSGRGSPWRGERKEQGGSSGGLGLHLLLPDYFGHRWIMTDSQEASAHLERKEEGLQGCHPSLFPFWGRVLWARIGKCGGWGGTTQLGLEM